MVAVGINSDHRDPLLACADEAPLFPASQHPFLWGLDRFTTCASVFFLCHLRLQADFLACWTGNAIKVQSRPDGPLQ